LDNSVVSNRKQITIKKVLVDMQTLCDGCCKVKPKFFCPATDPFPGVQDG